MPEQQPPRLPVAFHFAASFAGDDREIAFQEVDGLSSTIEVDNYDEGGENRFSHKMPKPVSHPKLVLKRGIVKMDSPLVEWCKEVLENGFAKPIEPKDMIVKLLDEAGSPARSWALSSCWPVKWDVDGFDSTKNSLAIETIELAYNTLRRDV